MRSHNFEQAVFDRWGDACVVCTRRPEEWNGAQDKLSFHHVNGDDSDDRIENVIPVCQSCHIHIHRVDEPPYRKWHRQLPIEHRNAWNEYYPEYYEGPRLSREEAERRFGDEGGIPVSIKYLRRERPDFDPDRFEPVDEEAEPEDAAGLDQHRLQWATAILEEQRQAMAEASTTDNSTETVDGSSQTTTAEDTTGVELQECPVCGRVGLPERIAEHNCRTSLNKSPE